MSRGPAALSIVGFNGGEMLIQAKMLSSSPNFKNYKDGVRGPAFELSLYCNIPKSSFHHKLISSVEMRLAYLVFLSGVAHASVSVTDPSDVIPPQLWAADNAIVPNYSVPFISVQPSAIIAPYVFDGNSTSIDHESFSTTLNDTSVILVADGAELNLSYVDIAKSGYFSNLLEASFYGFNAAVNVVSTLFMLRPHQNSRFHRQTHPPDTLTISISRLTMVPRTSTSMEQTASCMSTMLGYTVLAQLPTVCTHLETARRMSPIRSTFLVECDPLRFLVTVQLGTCTFQTLLLTRLELEVLLSMLLERSMQRTLLQFPKMDPPSSWMDCRKHISRTVRQQLDC